ncbi:RNA-guided pseudouridylation complex pseudouridine synthase subunit Cbf5 [Candidatus Woesearchaeota archaeon]|nr:RNA-guided pseudouridylation complex pseudouridine synthase subunit Cbf5 [Candidatus Woesearchaeota archaeon]
MGDLPFERIKRELLTRQHIKTSEKFGSEPDKRPIGELLNYGVVNIDKPAGPTSHQVSSFVQGILGINKSGHSGTLDPKVTGVLPVAIGRGTRIVQSLLTAGKEYVCLMHIHEPFAEEQLRKVISEKFIGKIKQLPPVKSAVKRQQRYRKIYYLEILEINKQDVLFIVGCQAGTYIRKLCHDIGLAMGSGAHMAELRRTKAGPFNETTKLCTLQDLTDAFHYYKENNDETKLRTLIQTPEMGVSHLPSIYVADTTVDAICQGATLKVPGIAQVQSEIQVEEPVAIKTLKGELIAVGMSKMISKDMVTKERGVAVKSSQVFMPTGTYPKIQKS